MADSGRPADRTPLKTKVVRSQRIIPTGQLLDDSDDSADPSPLPRSHTPGHLSSKSGSHDARRVPSDLSSRTRSQSASQASPRPPSRPHTANPGLTKSHTTTNGHDNDKDGAERLASYSRRPLAMRSTSAIASQASAPSSTTSRTPTTATSSSSRTPKGGQHTRFPPLQQPGEAPDVPAAPASGMYWSRAPTSGAPIPCLRAHATTLLGSNIYVFGGCDSRACFNDLYVLDADSFHWSRPQMVGEIPMPLRAMTCTAVGKKLVVFGGGDGPAYYNDVYVLDTVNFRWSKPRIVGDKMPSKRRAHTACLYKNGIYVFGGGDGVRALNDIWRLDVSDMAKMSWKLISSPDSSSTKGTSSTTAVDDSRPRARGYHTANMAGSKLIIYGGSDGGECFDDVWVYDVEERVWRSASTPVNYRRLSHTATIIGPYLFVVGGHDGSEYSDDVLLLNLVSMTWERRKAYGRPPSGRGYHGAIFYDSRLIVIGGFDGYEVFRDVMTLELAVHAYYSQISHFSIEV